MALGKSRRVRFARFGVCASGAKPEKQNGLWAVESENCEVGESLKRGVGVRLLYREDGSSYGINNTVQKGDYYFSLRTDGEEKIGFVTENGLLFLDNGTKPLSRHDFGLRTGGTVVYDTNDQEKMAFANENGVWIYDENSGAVKTALTSASRVLCFFKERLFCVQKPVTLAYSAPVAPSDFESSIDGGGKIALPSTRGEIVALVPMQEKLYVFHEYGICVLQGAGSGKEFSIREIPYHGARIFGDSVGACFEKAYFLTETGLYVLADDVASPACENLAIKPKTDGQVCAHAQSNGKYYLRYLDETGVATGLVVDNRSGNGYKCFAMTGLSSCKGESVCFSNGGFCRVENGGELPVGVKAYFTAKNLDFSSAGVKTLKSLRVFGVGNARVQACAGGRTRTVALVLTTGSTEAYIGVRGKEFSLKIELDKGAEITAIEAEVVE